MKPLIRTFITNPVLVHMITIGVIVFGTFSFLTMPRELNPNLNFYWMIVEVWYPGVSPEEIEKLITKPIEDEIFLFNLVTIEEISLKSFKYA